MSKWDWSKLSEETGDLFAQLKPGEMISYEKRDEQVALDFMATHQIGMHWPHPEERNKNEMIRAECELKDVAVEDHPGWGWWLCQPCGKWHKQGAFNIDTRS
jgi:hypothetical protein